MSKVSKSQIQFATVLVKVLQWFPGALEPNLDTFSDTQALPRSYPGLFGYISAEFCWLHVSLGSAHLFSKSEVALPRRGRRCPASCAVIATPHVSPARCTGQLCIFLLFCKIF